jgi:hypothetical protein
VLLGGLTRSLVGAVIVPPLVDAPIATPVNTPRKSAMWTLK